MRRLLFGLGVILVSAGCGGSDSSGLTGSGGASSGGANTGGSSSGGGGSGGTSIGGGPSGGAPSGGSGGNPTGGVAGQPAGGAAGTVATGGVAGSPSGGEGGTIASGGTGGTIPTGGTGGAPTGGTGGTGGSGGTATNNVGCADGQRDGFTDMSAYPNIAACAGGFTVAGVKTPASLAAQCSYLAGDDGNKPYGIGCSVADLCAKGWRVCEGAVDVQKSSSSGCNGAGDTGFFATRQSMGLSPAIICDSAVTATNNVVGCGNGGASVSTTHLCDPLTRILRTDVCPSGWDCGFDSTEESLNVTKSAGPGGVLCCRG